MRLKISIFLYLLVGCKSMQQNNSSYSVKNLDFQTIYLGSLFGNGAEGISKSNLVITNTKEWNLLLKKIAVENNVLSDLKKFDIDFSNEMLICVFDTIRPTAGFKIIIDRLTKDKDLMKIQYHNQKPPSRELVSMIITQPYHIIKTVKVEGAPIFINTEN